MLRDIMPLRKLAIITSHPIQYYAPVFRALAESAAVDLRVFYTWSQAAQSGQYDAGFGGTVAWDVPLLEGYAHQFVPNTAADPGPTHFNGLVNPSLIREIETWHADAVLVFGWSYRSHLRAMRHFKGRIPVLFRGDSTLLDEQSWWRTALRRVSLRWVYRHVDVALAVGANSRDYFVWCGIPASHIVMAPHSVDTVRFGADAPALEAQAGAQRLALGIDPSSVVFLFAGKLQHKKDPLLLLEAFRTLPLGAHLIYAGSGELATALKERAKGLASVHFLPFQNQSAMPTVYRLGDVLVLPSRGPGETWGLALNEAMACARAVIASTRVGGARDLIAAGENGWTFAAGDRQALGEVLRTALASGRTGLLAMGEAGLARSASWSIAETARGIVDAVRAARVTTL
jgi:glycosyltransferase involved in cell wall biosynthesis